MNEEQELPQNMQPSNIQERQICLPFEQPVNHNVGFYNWQATKSTLKERFSFLFNNEVRKYFLSYKLLHNLNKLPFRY